MKPLRPTLAALLAILFVATGFAQTNNNPAGIRSPVTVVTDNTWDVSDQKTGFGEFPLSADQCPSGNSKLYGGTSKAVVAEYGPRSKIIPGSVPIWRNRTAMPETEAYHFRKNVQLGSDPIKKITLEINCDDVARVYINKRLATVDKRDGTLKDGYDDWFTFRSLTGFTSGRIYTYDVTDYFFANVENSIVIEAISLAFDGSHAYISAKFVFEFDAKPVPQSPPKAPPAKPKPAPAPQANTQGQAAKPSVPEKTVFEAGRDPEFEKLRVGSILELGHVSFKADDYKLDTASYRTLNALASYMKRHPSLKIEVGGHTNLRPTDRFAAELSTNRANSVMRYLQDKGVVADRLTHKGYGKSQPRMNAVSKEADKANQRVEVKVLAK